MQNLIIPLNCNYSQENLFMKFHNCNIFHDSTLAIKDMSDCRCPLHLVRSRRGRSEYRLRTPQDHFGTRTDHLETQPFERYIFFWKSKKGQKCILLSDQLGSFRCQACLALQMDPNGDNKKTLQRKLVSGLLWDFLYQERLHKGTLDIFLESKFHSCFATMKAPINYSCWFLSRSVCHLVASRAPL